MMVPLGATTEVPLLLIRVPVPITPGAVVMGVLVDALPTPVKPALLALLTSDEAAAVREETPARSVGTR
jgi:hypothetical protein